jgi:exonuclease III
LQETHSTKNDEKIWEQEWCGKIFFSHGESNSKGVAILFPTILSIDINIKETNSDKKGRILVVSCDIENNPFSLVNDYAPTKDNHKDQIALLNELLQILLSLNNHNLLIGGDFNVCLDPKIDKKGGTLEIRSEYNKQLLYLIQEYSLVDIWRIRNPEKSQFTRIENTKKGIV